MAPGGGSLLLETLCRNSCVCKIHFWTVFCFVAFVFSCTGRIGGFVFCFLFVFFVFLAGTFTGAVLLQGHSDPEVNGLRLNNNNSSRRQNNEKSQIKEEQLMQTVTRYTLTFTS